MIMEYGLVKTLHILSATVLFGTGLGTAYFMWSAVRTTDTRVIASVTRQAVRADWFFTTPAIVLQPLSGAWLAQTAGYSWSGWIGWSIALYALAGLCWLPVVWLQLRMRDLAAAAVRGDQPLADPYWHYARLWFWLGVPAFAALIAVFYLMSAKPL